MAEGNQIEIAKEMYTYLCETLDSIGLNYEKFEEEMIVHFKVHGDDLPIDSIIRIDAERQLVTAISMLPFRFSDERKIDGAIAVCTVNLGLADGCFNYDLSDGTIMFKVNATYLNSKLGKGLFLHLINCTNYVVDEYNDKFFAIEKGYLSIEDFIADK